LRRRLTVFRIEFGEKAHSDCDCTSRDLMNCDFASCDVMSPDFISLWVAALAATFA
jgi:hypothetical protein